MKTIKLTQNKVALINDEDFIKVSQIKWYYDHGYAAHKDRKGKLYLHRFLLPNAKTIDHINHNGLDNRRSNLRICNQSLNGANQRMQTRPKSSRFKGVVWHKLGKKWCAQTKQNGRQVYLGLFERESEAALAYNQKVKELFGDFALLNKI